jgi:hypothetical protein
MPNIDTWLQCMVANSQVATLNQENPNKQVDAPSVSQSSTSLVDHTSVADFVTGAVNLATAGSGSDTGSAGNITVSAYAVRSAFQRQNPLDPGYYDAHPNWRDWSFVIGTDKPSTSSSTATSNSANPAATGKIVGFTYVPWNSRDLTRSSKVLNEIRSGLENAGMEFSFLVRAVEDAIFEEYRGQVSLSSTTEPEQKIEMFSASGNGKWTAVRDLISKDPAMQARINSIIATRSAALRELMTNLPKYVNEIRNRPQFSISGQTRFAETNGIDDYRIEMAFDRGMTGNLGLTLNGSFDYLNSAKPGADKRAGRLAADFKYYLTAAPFLGGKNPVSVDFSGESDWVQSYTPTYVGQFKLTIPILNGLELPLSVSYASQSNLLHEARIVGKFGITFDLSRLGKQAMQ